MNNHHHKSKKEDDHHHKHQGHHYLKNPKPKPTDEIVDHFEECDFLSFPRSTRISDKDEYIWPRHKLAGVLNGKIKVKPLEYNRNERKIMPRGSKVKTKNLLKPPTFCQKELRPLPKVCDNLNFIEHPN